MSYKEFSSPPESTAPKITYDKTYADLNHLIQPPMSLVGTKLLTAHLFVSTITLSLCSQFGLKFLGLRFNLYDVFMVFGHEVCMTLCGALFLGTTYLLLPWVFSKEELLKLKKHLVPSALGLIGLSLLVFALFDSHMTPMSVGLWVLGAMIGAYACLRAGAKIRWLTQNQI